MVLARRRRGMWSSYADQSRRGKTAAGKAYYRKTVVTGAGGAKSAKAQKATTRRRTNATKIAKVFKVVVAKRRKR